VVEEIGVAETASLDHIERQVDYTFQQGSASAVVPVEPLQAVDTTAEGDNLHGSDLDSPCVPGATDPVDKALHTGCNLVCLGVEAWR
jgi:hypothetical protein